MTERVKETEKPTFDIEDRGFRARAWHLQDASGSKGDALIQIDRDGVELRSFLFPSYKIWNIAAHFRDIVDGELAESDSGYRAAAWNGITPS